MHLTFLGKDSQPHQSPTLYATDRDSYIVQGWAVADPTIHGSRSVPDTDTLVEVPAKLLDHLAKDGLNGAVTNLAPPIMHVTADGNYIVQGARVNDTDALAQMAIPEHETCVEVPKAAMAGLLTEPR
jgi:hypothetical protein